MSHSIRCLLCAYHVVLDTDDVQVAVRAWAVHYRNDHVERPCPAAPAGTVPAGSTPIRG